MPPSDLDYYKIYRADNETGPFTLIATTTSASFVDETAVFGNTYCYYVVAVDAYANESPPSAVTCVYYTVGGGTIVEGGVIAAENVLVVYRDGDADSLEFAELYKDLHALDPDQLLAIPCSNIEVLSGYSFFQSEVEIPILDAMSSEPLSNRAIYAIVLCPFVCGGFIDGDDIISATSRLSRIEFEYSKNERNPLYNRQTFKRFDASDRQFGLICTRFDAPTLEIAKTWLDNTEQALVQLNVSGTFFIDPYSGLGSPAAGYTNEVVYFQDVLLPRLGLPITATTQVSPTIDPLIGSVEDDSFAWTWGADRGSLSYFKDTTNLRGFFYNADVDGAETMRDIDVTTWPLLAIRQNYVATAGSMSDPGYDGYLRPLPFFDALFRGATLAEAFMFSQPYLNSPIAVFGDPLLKFIFPNERNAQTFTDPDLAWQSMADCLAQAVAHMYRKTKILSAVGTHIILGDSNRVSDDLAYPFSEVKNVHNDSFWKNLFVNVTKSLINFGVTRNKSAYASHYPTLDEYLTRTGNKITEIVLDVLQNQAFKDSISASNIRDVGSWEFEFSLTHTPGTFAFYHIELDVASDADFEDILFTKRTLDDLTGWQYEDFGGEFNDFPFNGLTSNYAGRTVKYNSQSLETLVRGEFYHYRVRQRDQNDNYSDYRYFKRIVYT